MKSLKCMLCNTLSLLLIVSLVRANPPPQTCEGIWQQILTSLSQANCQTFENDQACYGHNNLFVSFRDNIPTEQITPFSAPGDRSRLDIISEINTSPLDMENASYGVGVLRFAAIVPEDMNAYLAGTRSGDTVQFILYGDSYLQSNLNDTPSPDDQDVRILPRLPGFYFFNGTPSKPLCVDLPEGPLPEGGLMVQSPEGLKVEFNANGANIRIGSSVLLQATRGQNMTVTVIEGDARVSVPGYPVVQLTSLQQTHIPLGGSNGLEAVGTPSVPDSAAVASSGINNICQLATLSGFYDPCTVTNPTSTTPPIFTVGQNELVNAIPNVLIRQSPSSLSVDRLWPVNYGDCVKIVDTSPQWNADERQYWVQVSTADDVHAGWVETNSLSEPERPVATISRNANIRRGDSQDFALIDGLHTGDTVDLLGVSSRGSGWYYVRLASGTEGWIHPSLVSVPERMCPLRFILPPNRPDVPSSVPPSIVPPTPTPYLISPQASFGITETKIGALCNDTATIVAFNNYSSNATSYYWYFGDGTGSSESNPSHGYQPSGPNYGDYINYEYHFDVTLEAIGQNGLTDTITITIPVRFHNVC